MSTSLYMRLGEHAPKPASRSRTRITREVRETVDDDRALDPALLSQTASLHRLLSVSGAIVGPTRTQPTADRAETIDNDRHAFWPAPASKL
jgi:hypothetical protein